MFTVFSTTQKYPSVIRTKFANFDDCVYTHSLEFPDFFPTFAQLYKAKPQLYIQSTIKSMPMFQCGHYHVQKLYLICFAHKIMK